MVARGPAAFFLQFRLGQQRDLQIRLQPRSALFHRDHEGDHEVVALVVVVPVVKLPLLVTLGSVIPIQMCLSLRQLSKFHQVLRMETVRFLVAVVAEVAQAIGRGQVRSRGRQRKNKPGQAGEVGLARTKLEEPLLLEYPMVDPTMASDMEVAQVMLRDGQPRWEVVDMALRQSRFHQSRSRSRHHQ